MQSEKDSKLKTINAEIEEINKNTSQENKTKSLQNSIDDYSFQAGGESHFNDVKKLFPKSNAMKHAAVEKSPANKKIHKN